MSKLIDIVKANGASVTKTFFEGPYHASIMEAQLRATVEQVAGPLVEALEIYRKSEMDGLGAVFNTPAKEALAAYTEIMGDKK